MKTNIQQFYIRGKWQTPASDTQIYTVLNPATQDVVATFPLGSEADVEAAVNAAADAFPEWSSLPASERQQWLLRLADAMQERAQEFAQAHTQTMGCPVMHVDDLHVLGPIEGLRKTAALVGCLADEQRTDEVLITHEAAGVCALINPWNYPLHQLIGKLAPALLAGCTVVVKPAEQTPLQDFILAQIIDDIGLPAGVFNLVFGEGAVVGSVMAQHPKVDLVSFTGSSRVGKTIGAEATQHIKKVCLELGGKSALIITEDANLEDAIRYGIENVMLNSGQTCDALTRMLLPRHLKQQAEALAVDIAQNITVGDPQDPSVFMGPLCNLLQQQRVLDYIQTGINEGATLLTGGLSLPQGMDSGAYVMPTLFSDVTENMTIAKEEIFGPVLCILYYDNIKEAIAIANNTEYGLSSGVYAKDYDSALGIARKLRAGQTYLQGAFFNYDAPFGGFKQSGNGREWTQSGLMEYTETKAFISPNAKEV
ncbi:aldehyde dehydrogenase family protein [Alteromonas sp. a30]|uniref:aldehyde dehydrogenase family protein n=1 Tax=Alteromonas sp. a30 TaxID=2730917 RepID=UPI00227DB95E|nr:aldehyde dehydrogenase family protein [Alteromonas sp. a30]MCY7295060.1 aldehyde dehydrogenase family protein [Alteromonas sp. a30]